jgi:CubicO group peptidase (beta-lactamase class C family)
VSSAAVLEFGRALASQIHEVHSFMLLRHGCVIAEGWWSPYRPDYRHMLFSVSKSFTATAVGLAIGEGRFSLDDLVLSFFPDEKPAEVSDFLAAMRVRHLLTMTTGQAVDSWSNMFGRPDGHWIRGFFELPVLYAPGTHFLYNTGATYMLAAIVQRTTGLKLMDYLEPRLFGPLGIENGFWQESPEGIAAGGIGLSLRTEDLARFGQLYLQKGMWQGERILSEEWIMAATAVQVRNGEGGPSDWTQGYGYQFWRCRQNAYRADGVFGQYCIVMPEQDAVLAITGGMDVFDMQEPLDLVWGILRPAMGSEPLVEDEVAHQQLTEKLATLSLPPVQGAAGAPIVSQVSGRRYAVDANELEIETVQLNFTEAGCTVMVQTATGQEAFACGYGRWQQGKTSLFNKPWLFEPTPVVSSGAWTAEDCFRMVVRLYETPFYQTLVYHFAGDEMMLEVGVNASLESVETLLITGQAA